MCHENQTRNLESVWKFFLSKDLMMGHENLRKNFAPRGSGHFWNFSEYIQMHQKGEYVNNEWQLSIVLDSFHSLGLFVNLVRIFTILIREVLQHLAISNT